MVSPIAFIAATLGGAFLLGLVRDEWRTTSYAVTLAVLAPVMSLAGWSWVWALASGTLRSGGDLTAGTAPPFAINLRMGLPEAVLTLLINLTGLLSALYLKDTMLKQGRRAMAVLLIFSMAMAGIVMTRDLFNLFVFFELMVISTGGLILLSSDNRALGAGFKFLVASQVISILMLVGIIFAYHATGSLNLDDMATQSQRLLQGGALAFFLIFIAVIAELKVFPANGWALDIYESAHPAFSAMVSAAAGSAASVRRGQTAADRWSRMAAGGHRHRHRQLRRCQPVCPGPARGPAPARLLLGGADRSDPGGDRAADILGDSYLFIAGGILLAHAVAKAGLFWLSGPGERAELTAWSALRGQPLLIFAFVTFVALLIGLPPFPGFYAKWELVHQLAADGSPSAARADPVRRPD